LAHLNDDDFGGESDEYDDVDIVIINDEE